MIQAVIFDMDGVLIDSEVIWEEQRIAFATERGKMWSPEAQVAVMGGTSREWAAGMKRIMALDETIDDIIVDMLRRVNARYDEHLPVLPGAVEAVKRIASRYRVGLASGSAAPIIAKVLALTGLDSVFEIVVSGDEMARGKPAPDIYIEAAARLNAHPGRCAGVEDSANGIRALHAAGLRAIAIPHPAYRPAPDVLALADVELTSINALTLDVIEGT